MLAGTGIVLLAATACGQRPAAHVGAPPPTKAPVSSSPTVAMPTRPGSPQNPPPGSTAVPGDRVDVTNLPADFPHEVYVSADGRLLYVRGQEGGCNHASAEVRSETAQQVTVDVVEAKSTVQNQMCTMEIRYPLLSVALAAPLGQRHVVLLAQKR
ncbi:hypothetical protein ORV05_07435 [Amycolatopsis cynarae]|uniref:Lipoprotein n=1 Tax=Amycolatopsis cynarae TaxID=2995223 RepID=A0ABY7B9R7_9PSEU|nr:hypothetical protein [Amycolatopsis sp. HUAS 11-8]WAL67606.1 hypothetical protein ORV05_07435 [Amycolatopsis sp. HUAS 11-8]